MPIFFSSLLLLVLNSAVGTAWPAQPQVQILSPKDGSKITQDQSLIFVSGKVARELGRSANVDIMLVIDISGSTAMYAGTDLGDLNSMPDNAGRIELPAHDDEVAAAHRLLLQLNAETTRVGVLTFSEGVKLLQPLTHDFVQVRRALDDILRTGPYGGTNMVEGIRTGISELMGLGSSDKRPEAVKVQFLLTDGFPSLPIGGGKRATPEDTNLAINSARLAGKAGIKVHVFALGEEALSYPRAAVGIAMTFGALAFIRNFDDDYELITRVDATMLVVAIVLSISASLLAGLLPTWRACQVVPALQLKSQ